MCGLVIRGSNHPFTVNDRGYIIKSSLSGAFAHAGSRFENNKM